MKKITSVIVSIALICTIFFPAIKLVTSADTVETAVLQLQTAWKDIRKKSNKLNLFAYNDGTNTVFFENGINESTVNVELKKIITGGNTEVPLAGVDDFVMYYKLPAESKDTKVKVEAVLDSYKQILQRDSMEVTLTADGEWHEFKLSDMYKSSVNYPTWQSYWAKELGMSEYNDETRKICKLSFYTNGGNKIPAGSSFKSTVMITKENSYPTADTSDWTATDWYNAAMNIDVNDYYNTDDFAAARDKLGDVVDNNITLQELQTAWKDIRKKSNKLNLFAYNDGTNTVFFENGINESTVNVELKKIITGGNTEVPLAGVDDFVMYYKLPAESKDTKVKVEAVLDSYKQILQRDSMEVTLTADGEWHEFKLSDMYKDSATYPTWQSYWAKELGMSEYNDETRKICKLSFYTNGGNKIPAGSSFKSTVMITKENGYPTVDTSDWTAMDWYNAAMDIDVNDYYNTDDFAAAREVLAGFLGPATKLNNLKIAWKKLKYARNELEPYVFANISGAPTFKTGSNEDNYLTDNTDNVANLGSKIATVKEARLLKYGNVFGKDLNYLDDVIMSYKIDAGRTVNMAIRLTVDWQYKFTKYEEITGDGEWHIIRLSDYYEDGDWRRSIANGKSYADVKLYDISFATKDNAYTLSGQFGTPVVLSSNGIFPSDDETKDYGLEDWIVRSWKVDASEYYDNEEFITVRDALTAEFPISDINMLAHVPATVYRTDTNGNMEAVSESDYNGTEHKLIYDGATDAAASIPINEKRLEFVFNLSSNVKLNKFSFDTLSQQIKEIKIYGADLEADLWKEDSVICNETFDTPVNTYSFYYTGDKTVRYLRYSIQAAGKNLEVTEIGAMTSYKSRFEYSNLAYKTSDSILFFTQDKSNGKTAAFEPKSNLTENGWSLNAPKNRPVSWITDEDASTVCDLYGGKNGEKSLNILIDLQDLVAIDSITFTAGSSKDYWPAQLNFYFGRTDKKLFDISESPNAKFDKQYREACEDGNYTYEFLPKLARYVRIEILETDHKYYSRAVEDMILAVIGDVSVNGLRVIANSGDNVASFIEPKSGIKFEILKLTINDIYEKIYTAKFIARAPSNAEEAIISNLGMKFEGNVFEVQLLDKNGNRITDLEGRKALVSIPLKETEGRYFANVLNGSWGLAETVIKDGYMICTYDNFTDIIFGIAMFEEEKEGENNGQDENNERNKNNEQIIIDIDEPYETVVDNNSTEENITSPSKRKLVKKVLIDDGTNYTWLIITISVVGSVILAGGVVLIIVLKKKRGRR